MTCSRFTSWSLPTEIDPNSTFNVVMNLEGYTCAEFPNPDYIFSGIADVDVDELSYRGWITTGPVDPGWVYTINKTEVFKTFYKDLTGLDVIPDVLHWKIATGPADPETKIFTATDSTDTVTIPVIKPMALPLAWIALGATALGVAAVGIVSYKKWR